MEWVSFLFLVQFLNLFTTSCLQLKQEFGKACVNPGLYQQSLRQILLEHIFLAKTVLNLLAVLNWDLNLIGQI
jgi:hypothetical protein